MGLNIDDVSEHARHWETHLGRGNRPYRKNWPSRLFRHEPIENAVEILKSGVLSSRNDIAGRQPRDIAPAEIINTRLAAHDSVRLYFRPKNPTQYRIEGIRKPHEVFQGCQAPVLIILVFRSENILTQEGTRFSDGNMQSSHTIIGSTLAEFKAIPFEQVYHEGVFDPQSDHGAEILRRRCAEVLLPSPLNLKGSLQSVLCRSSAERATLIHLLGDIAGQWSERVRVYTEPGLFENTYAYLSSVDGASNGIRFTYNARRDGASVATEAWIHDQNGELISHFGPSELNPGTRWIIKKELSPGKYTARFDLEGCFAYEAFFIVEDLPF